MKRKEPTHSEYPIHKPSSSSTSPHVSDYEGGTKRPKGNDYEVFLNFRGEDTRKGFTDYLYTSLVDAGIHVFRDDNELHVGEEIGPELLCCITKSIISIPIISENYSSSKWCLRELAHMLECKRSKGQIVLPIFYKVEPSQLRHLTGRWAVAINAHKGNLGEMVVKEWEEALEEISSLKGWESEKIDNGHEGKLVKIVVGKVMSELKRLFMLHVPEQLVGIDDPVEEIMSWIDDKFNGTRIIGIHGMGGIGKTTLAKVLYNKLSSHFEYLSFMANIRETSQRNGIECIQKQLISDIIRSSCDVSNVDVGIGVIKSRFTGKKVLILLDDVDDCAHLKALVGDGSWFETGSIVIITSRNKSILDKARATHKYALKELPSSQSLILFSRHAFRKDSPLSDYEDISRDVVRTTGGLPLALEVIGSFLCGKTKEAWKDTLKKLKKVPHKKVQETLRISYNALDYEDQQIFLDIACFFIGSFKQYPIYMWESCDFFPRKGIEVLSLMSLIKVDKHGYLRMHDQLRDLGREIVRLENPKEPQERSRLWINEEAMDVLESNKGTSKIEVIHLDKGGRYTAEQFKELTNLRFLKMTNAKFTANFQIVLPQLRWLECHDCYLDLEVASFHMKKLVVLDMSWTQISENWRGWDPLKMSTELKVLKLSYCQSLRKTPDLSNFKSLEILILKGCNNLEEIHPSIEDIKTLVSLDVSWCEKVKKLPAQVDKMEELKELFLNDTAILDIPIPRDCLMKLENASCEDLAQLPKSMDSIGKLASLTKLNLSVTGIEELPEFIGSLRMLETLDASHCMSLACIPSSIGSLVSLECLSLEGCHSLREIPDSIGKLTSLTKLGLSKTGIEVLPESIGSLRMLETLDASSCKSLARIPISIGSLVSLQSLSLPGCYSLRQIPDSIGKLASLTKLDLSETEIEELPESIAP
ncbi:disease resistance protein RPV1-like [Syzygium oleosum]|uniref:disease resistance protein RPV1-like n=1 Tax=Syzygium oleosum TaxID=219896 RepID=UPI0024BA1366|nr:disease resistance protein RPV1-like [Syzygium oleosum]